MRTPAGEGEGRYWVWGCSQQGGRAPAQGAGAGRRDWGAGIPSSIIALLPPVQQSEQQQGVGNRRRGLRGRSLCERAAPDRQPAGVHPERHVPRSGWPEDPVSVLSREQGWSAPGKPKPECGRLHQEDKRLPLPLTPACSGQGTAGDPACRGAGDQMSPGGGWSQCLVKG